MSEKPKTKKSSVRHTRAIQRDRTKRQNTAAPDEVTAERLMEIVHPLTLNQVAHFYDLGLRARVLNLPVMMAFVLSLIWAPVGFGHGSGADPESGRPAVGQRTEGVAAGG
jgi:hypothetical protein